MMLLLGGWGEGGGGQAGMPTVHWIKLSYVKPLQGLIIMTFQFPGRCPGLECIALSGHFFEGVARGGGEGTKDKHGQTRTKCRGRSVSDEE